MKGVIKLNIEPKDRNHLKDFCSKFHSRLEGLLFAFVQKIPEKYFPHWLIDWLDRYLNKRITELKQQSIKLTWKKMYLQDTVNDIHFRMQDIEKAPSDS